MPRDIGRQAKELNPGQAIMRIALTIGASGAVSAQKGAGLSDTVAPARSAAGQYTITLDRLYQGLVGFGGRLKRASGADLSPTIVSGDGTATTIVVETRVAAGTATDPASGDIVYLEFVFDETGVMK